MDELFGSDGESDGEVEQRPMSSGVMTFHTGTEESLFCFLKLNLNSKECPGNPSEILSHIDEFCYKRHWMMHMGDEKSELLPRALETAKFSCNTDSDPLLIVEFGSYCGYSAVKIAMNLSTARGDKLLCIENEIQCVQWVSSS